MGRQFLLAAVLAAFAGPAPGAPLVFYRGVVNAASFAPQGLPNGAIARGSIFSIFGRDLGPPAGAAAGAFPLGTTLAGVAVELCQAGQCRAAIPLFVSAGQINAIAPSNAPLGEVSLRVEFNGEKGNFTPVRVAASSFGIFAVNAGGFGPGIVQNFVSAAERPINSASATARRGQAVTIWGTGLGAALDGSDTTPPQVGNLPGGAEVWIGGRRAANVLYAGRSAEFPGLDQINVEVPADAPVGCHVPVRVRNGGVTSNDVTVAVGAGAGRCSNPDDPLARLVAAGRFGAIFLQRSDRMVDDAFGRRTSQVGDALIATFREESGSDFYFNPVFSPSPEGSCHVFVVRGDVFERVALPGMVSTREIDAGLALTLRTARGERAVARRTAEAPDVYAELLGGRDGEPLVFDGAGPFTVRGAGGAAVGAFEASVTPGPKVQWTNRAATNQIDRAAGVRLEYSGGDPARRILSVWGGGYDRPTNSSTMFACRLPPGPSSFTVPPHVLANVPPTRGRPFGSKGWLGLAFASGGGHAEFAAQGISGGLLIYSEMSAKTVTWR